MFSAEFAGVSSDEIVRSVKEKGYYTHPTALTPEFIATMREQIGPDEVRINHHGLSTVSYGRQFYLNQVLAQSKAAYDLVTSDIILDVSEAALGPQFRLTTKRYYTTLGGHGMAWHRDNKVTNEAVVEVEGLIWIFYLTDVTEGPFQFISNSHNLELDQENPNFPDELIQERYSNDIITFEADRGGMIVYNIATIHRAKPIDGMDYSRTSLFIGTMAEPTYSEPVLINTGFVEQLDDRKKYFLGFGKKSIPDIYPRTDVTTMDNQSTAKVYEQVRQYKESIGA